MIEGAFEVEQSTNTSLVSAAERQQLTGQQAEFYWISATSTEEGSQLAFKLEQKLIAQGRQAVVIDVNDARYDKLHSASEALRLADRFMDLELSVIFHSDASDLLYAMEQFSARHQTRSRYHIVDSTPECSSQQWYAFTVQTTDTI